MSDIAAATIMSSNRALYSWDLKVKKLQNIIFIDKRNEPNILNQQTINETSSDNPIPDENGINGIRKLMEEATLLTDSWTSGCVNEKASYKLEKEDPFIETEGQTIAKFGYLYKIWNIGGGNKVCIRCTVHSYVPNGHYDNMSEEEKATGDVQPEFMNVYALTEVPSKKESWIQTVDSHMSQFLTMAV